MGSSAGLALVVSRHLRPWNILDLHRNSPFGANSERGELPLGVVSSLAVPLQADEKLAGDGIQIDQFHSCIVSDASFAAEDRAKSARAIPQRRFDSVFVASANNSENDDRQPNEGPDFSKYDGPGR